MGDIDMGWDEVHRLAEFLEKQTNYDAAELVRGLRAALDAAEARAVGVKPLVWQPSPDPMGHDHWVASALGGSYHMAPDEDSPGVWVLQWTIRQNDFCMSYGGTITRHTSPEAAQAAAQADYTARILSALPSASPLGAVVMREKAADVLRDLPTTDGYADLHADAIAAIIEALPTTFTDDELLAAATELILQHVLRGPKEDKEDPLIAGAVIPWLQDLAALAPFTRRGK